MRLAIALVLPMLLGGCQAMPTTTRVPLHETSEGRLHSTVVVGPYCQVRYCGDLAMVDCGVAVDIPMNYYDNRSGERLSICGGFGADLGGCPPKAWTCPAVYSPYLPSRLRTQAKAWDLAIVRKDRAAIAANMSESFQQIGSDGRVADKVAFLDAITSDRLVIAPYEVEEFRVRWYGDTALVTGRTGMHGSWDGKPFESHYRFTDTYVREPDGVWRVVHVQTTEIAK